MNVLVFGATGPTGRHVLTQALDQGHSVTAFVRNPGGISIEHPQLRMITGDTAQDGAAIADAVEAQDVVVSTLGRGLKLSSDHLMERSMRAIVPATERAGVQRLVFMSAFGVGPRSREAPLLPRILYRVLLRDIFDDKARAEEIVRKSNIGWTIVQPVALTNRALTGSYRVGEHLDLRGLPTISRADVAHFLVREITDRAFIRKTVAISY